MSRFLSYRYVRFAVAAILLFAALTKTYQTAIEPFDGVPWLAMGHVLFETILAFMLLSGIWPRWTKYLTAFVFAVFFCVSLELSRQAAASCGCFGRVHVDPRITASLDAVVVLLLLFSSVKTMSSKPPRKQIILLVVGSILSFGLLAPMLFHPPVVRVEHAAFAEEKTEKTIETVSGLVPKIVDLGYVEPKSVHRFTLELINPTDEDWKINSVETECTCITVAEKPESVAAKEKSSIVFEFTAPDIVGPYVKTITVTAAGTIRETRMQARIAFPLAVEPEDLTFTLKEGIKEKRITIRNEGPTEVRLLYATVSPPSCLVKIGNDPIPPGGRLSLPVVQLDSRTDRTITLAISTSHRQQKTLRIPIRITD